MAVGSLCQTKLTLYSHELTLYKLSSLCLHERCVFVHAFTGISGWANDPKHAVASCRNMTVWTVPVLRSWSEIVLSRREIWDHSTGKI